MKDYHFQSEIKSLQLKPLLRKSNHCQSSAISLQLISLFSFLNQTFQKSGSAE
ncbi:hypothetical protein COXBURSA331_A1183 [Coxiella burnetii RSA 331]|nr:hypothetical protein COXBURSA331_A1183 [Coxiella burnetii RSA 331]